MLLFIETFCFRFFVSKKSHHFIDFVIKIKKNSSVNSLSLISGKSLHFCKITEKKLLIPLWFICHRICIVWHPARILKHSVICLVISCDSSRRQNKKILIVKTFCLRRRLTHQSRSQKSGWRREAKIPKKDFLIQKCSFLFFIHFLLLFNLSSF